MLGLPPVSVVAAARPQGRHLKINPFRFVRAHQLHRILTYPTTAASPAISSTNASFLLFLTLSAKVIHLISDHGWCTGIKTLNFELSSTARGKSTNLKLTNLIILFQDGRRDWNGCRHVSRFKALISYHDHITCYRRASNPLLRYLGH